MNAAMFGMIIPDRKVPNFCTATLAPDCPAGAAVDALTGFPLDATTDGKRIVGCPAVVGLRDPALTNRGTTPGAGSPPAGDPTPFA